MLSNFLDVRNDSVRFFIFEFLAETKYEVENEKHLNKVVSHDLIDVHRISKSGIIGLRKSVVAGCDEHKVVEV